MDSSRRCGTGMTIYEKGTVILFNIGILQRPVLRETNL